MTRRLLLLVHRLGAGGMEQQLVHLASGLAARGDAVTVGCFVADQDVAVLRGAGVRVLRLGTDTRSNRMTRALGGIARVARAHDLVHCTGWDASLWGRLGAIAARRPVVVTDHSPGREMDFSPRSGAGRGRLVAAHHRLLDPFTAATIAVAERQVPVLRAEGVRADGLVTIPNGVPLGPIRAAARAADRVTRADLGVPAQALVVVHVARFQPQKRQERTLAAVAELRRELGDVHVVFCGDGPDRAALEAGARREGAGWAHFLGVRDDVPAVLALADLAVLPSAAEALPMAMIEALAVGVPVVASDVGDVGRVLRETGGGLAVDADDPAAFTAACRTVLGDAALRHRLAAAAARGAERFDGEVMVERYSRVFDAAIAGRPPPA